MSLLSLAKRAEVVAYLCEGAGVRPCSRLTNVSQPTILSLLLKMGAGCDRLHDRLVRDLDIRDIQAFSKLRERIAELTALRDAPAPHLETWIAAPVAREAA